MPHRRSRRRAALAGMAALGLFLMTAGPAFGASDHKTVKVLDDCDPATFNAALQDPNACVGDGRTTFDEFIAEFLATPGSVKRWQFDRDEFGLEAGGVVTAVNEGGEFHSFSEVTSFGGGCVDLLNAFEPALAVPRDCETLNGGPLPAGATLMTGPLSPGTHRFQCLIHPWMRSVVNVEGDDDEDSSGEG